MAVIKEGIVISMVDSDERVQATDFDITGSTITVPTGAQAAVDGLATLGNGTVVGKMFMGYPLAVRFYIDVAPTSPLVRSTHGDIRDKWEFEYANGERRSIGGRNTIGDLTTLISDGEFADVSQQAYIDLIDVLFNGGGDTPAGFGIVDKSGSSPVVGGVRAVTRARKRK